MLRPEKSWRPIVTMEVDGQHKHEIALGIDGQNPNQREIMHLCVTFLSPMHDVGATDFRSHCAHHKTEIKLNVWHKSQSKAKSRKRRHLVAWTALPLGEVMKKQGTDPCEPPHISHVCCILTKTSPHRRGTSPVRHPRCTKKVCSTKISALRFSAYSTTTTTVVYFACTRTRYRRG